MWYLAKPINNLNLIDAVNRGREPAVYAEDLVVYYYRECQVVEHIRKIVPDVCVAIFSTTFSVKSIGLGNTSRLVVPPDQMDAVWIAKLETNKQGDGLHAEKPTIDVVT